MLGLDRVQTMELSGNTEISSLFSYPEGSTIVNGRLCKL